MNKRLEEKLAMLAFGDMGPEETMRLEREVAGNSEATRILAEYRGMRTGLKAMGDIPEHQLSTERLRHAVLNRGLKPKARPQLGWLWMPTVTGAIAFGIVFLRNTHNSDLSHFAGAIKSNGSASLPDTLALPRGDVFASATASGEVVSVEQVQPKMKLASRPLRRHGHSSRDLDLLREAVREEFLNEYMTSTNPAPRGRLASAPAGSAGARSAGAPIVLIDNSRDTSTGAQKATEVDSSSNVVVGG